MERRRKSWELDSCESAGQGRDELNLAEFPIAAVASRLPKGQKTLTFEDRIWDKSQNRTVLRRLTISASDKYGLPTAKDDDVILGLIQITRETDFQSRQVFFSRYQLIKLLGWRNEGKSYSRLETSLKRWLGVTLFYENAWWNKAEKSWVDENFHILEQVSLYDRERRLRCIEVEELPLSSFCWNDVVFRSFKAGYLKRIDLELFRRLRGAIAKRLYRVLDKRFYHKGCWDFDLRELACEHVGVSRNYDASQIKRRLSPAIAELEAVRFLRPMSCDARFQQLGPGKWNVRFVRQQRAKTGTPAAETKRGKCGTPTRSLSRTSSCVGPPPAASRRKRRHEQAVKKYLESLGPDAKDHLEQEAMRSAEPLLASCYKGAIRDGNARFAAVYRQAIVNAHVAALLKNPNEEA